MALTVLLLHAVLVRVEEVEEEAQRLGLVVAQPVNVTKGLGDGLRVAVGQALMLPETLAQTLKEPLAQ